MASDPRIEAVARAMSALSTCWPPDDEAEAWMWREQAKEALAAADAADPLRDRDRMLKAIEDGYERIVRAGFAFTTGDLAGAVFAAIQEASDGK